MIGATLNDSVQGAYSTAAIGSVWTRSPNHEENMNMISMVSSLVVERTRHLHPRRQLLQLRISKHTRASICLSSELLMIFKSDRYPKLDALEQLPKDEKLHFTASSRFCRQYTAD